MTMLNLEEHPKFKIADPAHIEVKTEPISLSIGLPHADLQTPPRIDLNGLRVKIPQHGEIYLIDQGYRRWIPNPETYNNLFRDWSGIVEEIAVADIPRGQDISSGAILAVGSSAGVFLVDQGQKRWITSPAAMDKYNFSWQRIYHVPNILLSSISTGSNIS